ncbi:MAG: QueT transporter family protein, partial [Oscillospiraceae bacterium]|nr:QueT transporter family protein [Oscillospiraceae bacterium]
MPKRDSTPIAKEIRKEFAGLIDLFHRPTVRQLTTAGLVAAAYAAVTMVLAPISYGPIQLRISEAMTLLPVLFPESVPGLFIGCVIANLMSQYRLPDVVFGSLAILIAATLTYILRKNTWLAALLPALVNAAVVGWLIWWQAHEPFFMSALTVGGGEALSVYILGFAPIA